jgi:hypothetical protein
MVYDADIETVSRGLAWGALPISLREHRHPSNILQSKDRQTSRGTASNEYIQTSGHVKELLLQVGYSIRVSRSSR